MKPQRPLEADLHAYADARLEPSRHGEVEAWLATHPEDAERVHAWRRHKEALHAGFDPVLDEPLPDRLLRAARPAPLWPLRRLRMAFDGVRIKAA